MARFIICTNKNQPTRRETWLYNRPIAQVETDHLIPIFKFTPGRGLPDVYVNARERTAFFTWGDDTASKMTRWELASFIYNPGHSDFGYWFVS